MKLLKIALVAAGTAALFAKDPAPSSPNLVTHEWGTFTSVAGMDGNPVEWAPLVGTGDLPCFVSRLGPVLKESLSGLVRMETPVLYFYAPSSTTVSVHVGFPQGWITEWYPEASRKPLSQESLMAATGPTRNFRGGQIDWDSVQVSPGENAELPSTKGPSRYYAARNTDSAVLHIGGQTEKLIFYRGVGDFVVPLRAKVAEDGLEIRNASSQPIPLAILFESRGGKLGYRIARDLRDTATLKMPELTGSIESLRAELAGDLVELGLYRKEALAMVETWHDSWFEDGMRVFYIVPRSEVDKVLPLTITPAPSTTTRVFVGRVEVLSPSSRRTIETALSQGDIPSLVRFGRFLSPFVSQIRELNGKSTGVAYAAAATDKIRQEGSGSCVK